MRHYYVVYEVERSLIKGGIEIVMSEQAVTGKTVYDWMEFIKKVNKIETNILITWWTELGEDVADDNDG